MADAENVLAEIRARAAAATPGPWRLENNDDDPRFNERAGRWDIAPGASRRAGVVRHWRVRGPVPHLDLSENGTYGFGDLAFIAGARQDVPRLLAAVEAALATHPLGFPVGDAVPVVVCGTCSSLHGALVEAPDCDLRRAVMQALGEEASDD